MPERIKVPEPAVTVTRYEVSCMPLDSINALGLTVTVEHRGNDRWAVKRLSSCYDIDGNPSYESIPSEREEEWLERYRHDLDTALELAKRIAPTLKVNGHSIADVLLWESRNAAEGGAR
ncbi:hypothetical protein [Nocardia sp. NPDC003963]